MRASPGTTHTFDIIPRHGCVRVIWPATGHGLDDYEVERIGDTGHIYRVLPGHHVMGALEWHQRPGVQAFSTILDLQEGS